MSSNNQIKNQTGGAYQKKTNKGKLDVYHNRFTPKIKLKSNDTTGTEHELRRFVTNEYLTKRDPSVLIGADLSIPDNDPPRDSLWLTNAITENRDQDNIDKTRYLKETKSYITINSAARNQPTLAQITSNENMSNSSLYSTGGLYGQSASLAPFIIRVDASGNITVPITTSNNHIFFKLKDYTLDFYVQIVVTPEASEVFSAFIPINNAYSISDLATAIETSINLVAATGIDLSNSSDPNHMFTVLASYDAVVNPDRVTLNISCQTNFKFTMNFYSSQFLFNTPIAESISASDAAYTIQDPASLFPSPNSYALNLGKAYLHIKSIRIVSSEIPNSDTIINLNNNHITLQLIDKTLPEPNFFDPYTQNIKTSADALDWEIRIPPGNYTVTQLADELETLINTTILGEAGIENMFEITVNESNNSFEINTADPYAFRWDFNALDSLKWRNLYRMLGFPEPTSSEVNVYVNTFDNLVTVNTGSTSQVMFLKVPYATFNLKKSNIIWLQLNNYETIYDTLTGNKYFCKFNLDNVSDNQVAFDTFTPSVHIFTDSPLTLLNVVDVRFYDETGEPYNFNNIDQSFTIEIVHHIDRLMGVDFSSRRGVNDKTSYV